MNFAMIIPFAIGLLILFIICAKESKFIIGDLRKLSLIRLNFLANIRKCYYY